MAEVIVSVVLDQLKDSILRDRITEEVRLFYNVEEEIESIRPELQMMKCFLKDADARQDDERIRQWVREIKSLSHRIEDALETYAINVESAKRKGLGKFLRAFAIPEKAIAARKTVIEIRAIKSRIAALNQMLERYGVKQIVEEKSSAANEGDQDLAEISLLVALMVKVEKSCPVISICGMGGTGKTTLAMKVFYHSDVESHFPGRARVSVGPSFQRRKILEDILVQFGVDRSEMAPVDDARLAEKLNEILKKRKCLVFLDDIWDLDAWESLRIDFPFDNTGSKYLLTTRMREVAEVAAEKGYIHTMRPLTEDEIALSRFGPEGSTATKHTLGKRDLVHQTTDSCLNSEGISEIPGEFASRFYGLPYRLKPCFLFLGFFPEGSKIETDKLFLLWMADGIIELEDRGREETMMEIAEQYLKELEQRRLVEMQEEEVPTVTRFKACSLHAQMQKLCLRMGKEDDFVKVIHFGKGSQLATDSFASDFSSRRLVVCLDKYEGGHPVPLILQSASYLWCLLIYSTCQNEPEAGLPPEISKLSKFKLLKSLDFDGIDFRKIKLPSGISALIRLRYLSFKGCVLEALPSEIGSLSYLLGLDLRVRPWCKMTIPNVLWKLRRLKHLYLPEAFETSKDRILRLNGLTELETLMQFNSNVCHAEDLSEMINLRYLATSTEGRVEDLEWIIRRMSMSTEHTLRSSVDVRNFDCYTEERHNVFRKLVSCRVLQTISMEGHLFQIPPSHEINQSLMEIVFSGSQLREDPLLVLANLPNLRVLVLNDDAYLGAEMFCSETSFPELKRLELSNLHFLEKWKIDDGALGKLTTLAIENCSKLELLPPGVKFVSNVKNRRIRNMPSTFEERLRVINETAGEDVGNVPDVTPVGSDNS